MIEAFTKGLSQLRDPAARKAVWMGLLAATLVFSGLWAAVFNLLALLPFHEPGWQESLGEVLGGAFALVLTWFLFPGVVSSAIGLFLEDVVKAVEARHYPDLPAVREVPLREAVGSALKFLAVMVALNLLVLLFLFTPPLFPFVFYGVNGYLLGREYFELVALRRMSRVDARVLRRRQRLPVLGAGVTTALFLTVPVVNLFAPVVSVAAMVHLVERWRREN